MVIRKDFTCGLDAALAVMGGKWKPLVLYFLAKGPRRFSELRRLINGVSEKVLIQHLKELERDGIVDRTDHHEVPPRVDYAITPLGHTLAAALAPLCQWGEEHREDVDAIQGKRLLSRSA
jgi:DNA-binding HxlR family transcriptional regulator